jgi:hypothetical protein
MASIVIDKSFLQGTPAKQVHALASEHRLLMSDALLYELLTTKEKERRECFSKLPDGLNPVDFVSHIGTLMRMEIETQKPSGCPSSNKEDISFFFNDRLKSGNYVYPDEVQAAIDEETVRLKNSIDSFIKKAGCIPSLFPDIMKESQTEKDAARLDAEKTIASPGALLPFLEQLKSPSDKEVLPSISSINEDWVIYRWLQVQLLFAIDLHMRYQGKIRQFLDSSRSDSKVLEKLEHDVLDAEVLMLGCLERAFATQEKKLKSWFGCLCPKGTLYKYESLGQTA